MNQHAEMSQELMNEWMDGQVGNGINFLFFECRQSG